jgi:hypothetical protein
MVGVTEPITADLLADAPELATLAVLERSLLVATQALIAEHSTLRQVQWPLELQEEPATLREARRVLRRITPLQAALLRYQRAVLEAVGPRGGNQTEDLPF